MQPEQQWKGKLTSTTVSCEEFSSSAAKSSITEREIVTSSQRHGTFILEAHFLI